MNDWDEDVCPLCDHNCEVASAGNGWVVYRCNDCFWYRYHDSVKYGDIYTLPEAEQQAIARKRHNAIYNFLLKAPKPKDLEKQYAHYRFEYSTSGETALPSVLDYYEGYPPQRVNVVDLLPNYPESDEDKLNAIIDNLVLVYGKNEINLNTVPSALLYANGDISYWLNVLKEKKIITDSRPFTLTAKAFEQSKKNKASFKPRKFDNVDKKYVDDYTEACNVLDVSTKSCAMLCRVLVDVVLREKCGCTEHRL